MWQQQQQHKNKGVELIFTINRFETMIWNFEIIFKKCIYTVSINTCFFKLITFAHGFS